MSATRPHSKREINRSSSPGISFGGRSEVSTICLCPSNSALNVWKNSSCVISLPSRKCTSSTRKRSTSLRYRRRNSDRVRGRRGELVRLSDHERLERVSLVERRGRDAGPVDGRRLSWRHEEIHLGPLLAILLHPEHDRRRPSEHALGGAGQDGGVLRLVPFDGELIGSSDDQAPIVQRDRHRGLEPRPHRSVGKFAPRFVEESLPSFFS